jgi:hypothetical protein
MVTSSVFYIEPSHIQLTSSTFKGFVDRYGSMVQIKKLKIILSVLTQTFEMKQKSLHSVAVFGGLGC